MSLGTVCVASLKCSCAIPNFMLDELQYRVYELAGVEFNIGSSQQKAEILFGYRKDS